MPPVRHLCSDPVFARGLERVHEYLASSSAPDDGGGGGAGACLVCLGPIQQREAVWSCQSGCFAVIHLTCTQVLGGGRVGTHTNLFLNRLPADTWT